MTVSPLQMRCEKMLEELVRIDSSTTNIAGVERAQALVARELVMLGFRVRLVQNPNTNVKSADLLIAEFPGSDPRFITCVTHTDTVLPRDACGGFRKEDTRAFGSGVIDNKGGIVVLIEAVRLLLERGQPRFSLRIVCSPNEEAGSLGFHDEFRACSLNSALVLGFEPALENGSIVESRRGNRWYSIKVTGVEAHAGRCRGEQINAAHEIAIKIAKFHELNDPAAGIALNIAQLQGGRDRYNIVCGEVSAKLDTRFASFEAREKLHAAIEKILSTSYVISETTGKKSEASYEIVDDCPPFSNTPLSEPVLKFIRAQIAKLEGSEIGSEKAGGAGDVNYMSREGLVVVDGLGPVGGFMHTKDEFVRLSTLATRALAVAALFAEAPALV